MSGPDNLFAVARGGLSAQLVRMNAAASNLANAGAVSGSEAAAYRPVRAVFAEDRGASGGLSTVRLAAMTREDAAPVRRHDPHHPLADADGHVWEAPVSEAGEMVEIMEAARQYQNLVEAVATARQLMLDTMRTSQ